MTEAAPFMQGVRAHLAGMPKHMNPYRVACYEQSNWDDGWDHAEEYREQIAAEKIT